jgi:curli production assembly/transport component CsgE
VTACCPFLPAWPRLLAPAWGWLLLGCAWGSPALGWAQAPARSATKSPAAPKVIVTPSKKPLPPAQLEEALRLLLRADSTSQRAPRPGAEAEGLVLDQAISKPGHDFYDLFYTAFEAPAGATGYTVLVGERPGRANSSLLVLTVNEQELLETPLPTRLDQMEELVADIVGLAQSYLVEVQSVSGQLEKGHHVPLEVY